MYAHTLVQHCGYTACLRQSWATVRRHTCSHSSEGSFTRSVHQTHTKHTAAQQQHREEHAWRMPLPLQSSWHSLLAGCCCRCPCNMSGVKAAAVHGQLDPNPATSHDTPAARHTRGHPSQSPRDQWCRCGCQGIKASSAPLLSNRKAVLDGTVHTGTHAPDLGCVLSHSRPFIPTCHTWESPSCPCIHAWVCTMCWRKGVTGVAPPPGAPKQSQNTRTAWAAGGSSDVDARCQYASAAVRPAGGAGSTPWLPTGSHKAAAWRRRRLLAPHPQPRPHAWHLVDYLPCTHTWRAAAAVPPL